MNLAKNLILDRYYKWKNIEIIFKITDACIFVKVLKVSNPFKHITVNFLNILYFLFNKINKFG